MNVKPTYFYDKVQSIDINILKNRNIKLIAFDIDNTLAIHDETNLSDGVEQWLDQLEMQGFLLCFISNNSKERVDSISCLAQHKIYHKANKPFTRIYKQVMKDFDVSPSEMCMVGDQLFTDIIGANKLSICTILVERISSHETNLIKLKRLLEKPFLRKRS